MITCDAARKLAACETDSTCPAAYCVTATGYRSLTSVCDPSTKQCADLATTAAAAMTCQGGVVQLAGWRVRARDAGADEHVRHVVVAACDHRAAHDAFQ